MNNIKKIIALCLTLTFTSVLAHNVNFIFAVDPACPTDPQYKVTFIGFSVGGIKPISQGKEIKPGQFCTVADVDVGGDYLGTPTHLHLKIGDHDVTFDLWKKVPSGKPLRGFRTFEVMLYSFDGDQFDTITSMPMAEGPTADYQAPVIAWAPALATVGT